MRYNICKYSNGAIIMKAILAPSGFVNEEIIGACEKLVEKPRQEINFIVINEAIKAEQGDCRWLIDGLNEIADNFGGVVELLDLQAHDLNYIESRIRECDVVFCFGGQTNYLREVFEKTKFVDILPEILAEKVWVGSSAGSCVLGYSANDAIEVGVFEEPQERRYLKILPMIVLPHFGSKWFPDLTEEKASNMSRETDLLVYLLSDESAVVVTGDNEDLKFDVIGSGFVVLEHGEVVEKA